MKKPPEHPPGGRTLIKKAAMMNLFFPWVKKAVRVCLLFCLALISSAPAMGRAAEKSVFSGAVMGTFWHVTAACDPSALPRDFQEKIQARLDGVNATFSYFDPKSELSRFNAHPAGRPFEASPAFFFRHVPGRPDFLPVQRGL